MNRVDVNDYLVTLNGAVQAPSAYTINSSTKDLSFVAGAPAAGVAIVIRTIKSTRSKTYSIAGNNYVHTNVITVQRLA
jgi:hypothetical protein